MLLSLFLLAWNSSLRNSAWSRHLTYSFEVGGFRCFYGICEAASNTGGSPGLPTRQHWNLSRIWLHQEWYKPGQEGSDHYEIVHFEKQTLEEILKSRRKGWADRLLSPKWDWHVGRNILQQMTPSRRMGLKGDNASPSGGLIFCWHGIHTERVLHQLFSTVIYFVFKDVRYNIQHFRYVCISSAACLELLFLFFVVSPLPLLSLFHVHLYSDSDCQRSWPSFSTDQQSSSVPSSPGNTHFIAPSPLLITKSLHCSVWSCLLWHRKL